MAAAKSKTESELLTAEEQSFETALDRLQLLVRELEQGDVPLERSLAAFEDGQRLIKFCQTKLNAAETALKQLAAEADEALGNDKPRD